MYSLTQDQFNRLNVIALTLVRKVDTKTYDEMCEILSDVYKTDIAENEECAKDISVGLCNQAWLPCPTNCTIRGTHSHIETF